MKTLLSNPKGNTLLYLPWKFDMLGGVDVVVDRLWKGLEKIYPGHTQIGIQDWGFEGILIDQQGRHFLHLNSPAPPGSENHLSLRYLLTLAKRLPNVLRILNSNSIKTINAHYPTQNLYPFTLLKKMGLWRGRIVLSFHGSDVGEISQDSIVWKNIAEQTDAVTACSLSLAKRINNLKLFKQSVHVTHNGINSEEFISNADHKSKPTLNPYILNVGNYVPHKGQDILLDAFCKIADKHPRLHLVFAGGTDNGIWLQHLRQVASQSKNNDRIHFLQNITQQKVAGLMKDAICFAHAARLEAFGLVIIEAGACGIPVIAANVGGIPEIILSSAFGLIFENGNASDLAEKLDDLLVNKTNTNKRVTNLRQRIHSDFSAEAMVFSYYKILKNNY